MPPDHIARLAPEQHTQVLIDSQLVTTNLEVQDTNDVNPFAVEGVAVREAVIAAVFEPEPKKFFMEVVEMSRLNLLPGATCLRCESEIENRFSPLSAVSIPALRGNQPVRPR